jgi:hypothetical protein
MFLHFSIQPFSKEKNDNIGWNVSYDFCNSNFEVVMKPMPPYLMKAGLNKDPQIF